MTLSEKKNTYLTFFLLSLLILIIYGQTVFFDYGLDDQLINENIPGRTEGIKGLIHIFQQRYSDNDYRPMVILSYSIEKWITGVMNPHTSHIINIFLFFLVVISLYITFNSFIPKNYHFILSTGLFIFIAHPVHTEVIASLKCRDNL